VQNPNAPIEWNIKDQILFKILNPPHPDGGKFGISESPDSARVTIYREESKSFVARDKKFLRRFQIVFSYVGGKINEVF
jgi:hypothetical protein